ncbi:hypothetical protein Krac_5789 [Ktedonobacter racemifer DSM 44963]|uniref:Uncharacterized protein n=1 Tax=Ktedonobacter racemifer DSM 44963 TaxID=485913 RepID=D6TWV6_KTERA|nr:hypothetical protein Krac_5789 [Ktedonobacter racemifer DSM 44963]
MSEEKKVVLQKIKAQQIEAHMNKFHEDKMQNIHLFSAAMILVP